MKKCNMLKAALLVLFVSFFISCSDSDNSPAGETYFKYKIDGQDIAVTSFEGVKKGEKIVVKAMMADGRSFSIEFNTSGNIDTAKAIDSTNIGSPVQYNSGYNKKQHFDFQLISLENGMVKGTFSGEVYGHNFIDFTSNSSLIEGSFYIPYTTQEDTYPMSLSAKINGSEWNYSAVQVYSDFDFGYSAQFMSDDAYWIRVKRPHYADLHEGIYTFDFNGGAPVWLELWKYTSGNYPDQYQSFNGNLEIISRTVIANGITVEGTFSFTATNPETGEVVTVNDGKLVLSY